MDERSNPFAPGAGTQPPELAGRGQILANADVAIARLRESRPVRGQMLLGLRGVGKTVLLNRIEDLARNEQAETILIEAPEGGRLPNLLQPQLRRVVMRLSMSARASEAVRRSMSALRNFTSMFSIKIGEYELSITPSPGLADSGDLSLDLADLLMTIAEAAQAAERVVVLMIDEVQYLSKEELGALIVAVHRTSQKQLPLLFVGAGLPQLAGIAGETKSYAERLFDYPEVGALSDGDAGEAIAAPLRNHGAEIAPDALREILAHTQGYPYFLQEWGYHSWNIAKSPLVDMDVVKQATGAATEALDKSFFNVRFSRLSRREADYVWAMAELGPGPQRSGAIAAVMGAKVNAVAPLRATLIKKGMIYSPSHGDAAFTVPMFDRFLQRHRAKRPR